MEKVRIGSKSSEKGHEKGVFGGFLGLGVWTKLLKIYLKMLKLCFFFFHSDFAAEEREREVLWLVWCTQRERQHMGI